MTNTAKKTINQLVKEQKENGEETEFYPTTQNMVNKIASYLNENVNDDIVKILDIGCGNGCFFDKLDKADCYKDSNADWDSKERKRKLNKPDKYGIEKSLYLLNSCPDDITILGTDFYQNNLIDKPVDLVFCNPPYSDFKTWTKKIITEANSKYIVLVIPSRWSEDSSITKVIDDRNYEYDIISSDNFLDAERKARAYVDLVFIHPKTDRFNGRVYESGIKDPFDYWFENTFKINADKEKTYSYDTNELKKEAIKGELTEVKNVAEVLVKLYNRDMESLYANYKALENLDSALLKELSVNIEGLKKSIKEKLEGLKSLYWHELFDRYDKITSRLTHKKREEILNKLGSNINIDFTEENIYQLTFWIIRNANRLFDEQLTDYFFKLCNSENIHRYKSNKRWNDEEWRYIKEAAKKCNSYYYTENREKIKNIQLDYRIVTTGNSNFSYDYWDKTYGNKVTKEAWNFINDTQIIAQNLGFDIEIHEYEICGNFDVYLNGNVFCNFKLYKNGNRHLKFDPEFMKKLNIEIARICGWVTDKTEAEKEFQMTEMEMDMYWNKNFTLNTNAGLKLLGFTA